MQTGRYLQPARQTNRVTKKKTKNKLNITSIIFICTFAVYDTTIIILQQYIALMGNTARCVCCLFGYLSKVLKIPKLIYQAVLLF